MISAVGVGLSIGLSLSTIQTPLTIAIFSKEFFMDIFLHPENYGYWVLGFSVVAIGTVVGTVYLVKLLYEKYRPAS